MWLAEVGRERIEETIDPEQTIDRALATYEKNFEENKSAARRGGRIAGNARKELEAEIGHSVISEKAATEINSVVTNLIENVVQGDKND